jgi:hypothetical protein
MLVIPVIHPGIRLTWIRKHWGPEFVPDAETKIKDLVCHVVLQRAHLLINDYVLDG